MLDRTKQPELKTIDKIDFVAPIEYKINENVSLYHMKDVPNATSRFDLYFDAGKCHGEGSIASFVNGLILSGTEQKTSIEINNEINSKGGFYESGVSQENSVISLYSLSENLLEIFETITDAIENVAFIEKEVKEFLGDKKQGFNISLQKVNYLAQRAFQEDLFKSSQPYAKTTELSDFEHVQIDDLKSFHRRHYLKGLSKIVVVGDLDEASIQTFINRAKDFVLEQKTEFASDIQNKIGSRHVMKENAVQSAVRVGRILFNKNHPDYLDFLVLNTILGDYFGSRLMSNIREDKGYTYGIGTMVAELNETGYFMIATEVGTDVKEATLKEIQIELTRLKNELVPLEEMELVKNYMLGQLLKSADGPYAMTDLFISAELHGLDLNFYNKAINALNEITPERIKALANKYLNWEEMTIVTAG
ncbi:MAG: insulinase family protein [Crocinitomicaceae bacterium]|nr:insulinase family protein [Crocinitomicaceae bacterium]